MLLRSFFPIFFYFILCLKIEDCLTVADDNFDQVWREYLVRKNRLEKGALDSFRLPRMNLEFDPALELFSFGDGTQAAIHSDSIQDMRPIFNSSKGVVFAPKLVPEGCDMPSSAVCREDEKSAEYHPLSAALKPAGGKDVQDHVRVIDPKQEGFGFVGHLNMDLLNDQDQVIRRCIGSCCLVEIANAKGKMCGAITAAHNIYSRFYGKPFSRVECHLGRAGDHSSHIAEVMAYVVHPSFIESAELEAKNHDIALILFDRPLEDGTEFVPCVSMSDEDLLSGLVKVVGYPAGIREEGVWHLVNGTQMAYTEGGVEKITPYQLFYSMMTCGGQSGGGVLNAKKELCAIHAHGPYGGEERNRATRLTTENIQWVQDWYQRFITSAVNADSPEITVTTVKKHDSEAEEAKVVPKRDPDVQAVSIALEKAAEKEEESQAHKDE